MAELSRASALPFEKCLVGVACGLLESRSRPRLVLLHLRGSLQAIVAGERQETVRTSARTGEGIEELLQHQATHDSLTDLPITAIDPAVTGTERSPDR